MIPVEDAEQVARAMFSPSFFTEEGEIGPQAFYMEILKRGEAEAYISLFRLGLCDDIKTAIKRIPPRKPGDEIRGYGELNVGEIRRIQIPLMELDEEVKALIDVIPTPSKNNPAHAGIIIKMNDKSVNAFDFYTPNGVLLESINPILMYIMDDLACMANLVTLQEGNE